MPVASPSTAKRAFTASRPPPVPHTPTAAVGRSPLRSEQLSRQASNEPTIGAPELTYGIPRSSSKLPVFVPSYVNYDKKVLRFLAYFKEQVQNSTQEVWRVRPVNIYYYLEDDTMEVYEPKVENSGLLQGKRTQRRPMPKSEHGEYYHWRDLNLAVDLEVCGFTYHITQCDTFTKEFMERGGMILNDPEPMPMDPYTERRKICQPTHQTPSEFDSLQQYLVMDGKVLRFHAVWDNPDNPDKKSIIYVTITYFLVNDTVEIREISRANSGRESFPILMRRLKLPKKFKPGYDSFPKIIMEVSSKEVDQYYSPKDFKLGKTVRLLDRDFLLYDCDGFTKGYYKKHFPEVEMKPIEMPKEEELPPRKMVIPPYNGFGSLEDSEQNCLHLIPKPPTKNMLRTLHIDNKVLRYSAVMEMQNPRERNFLITYHLAEEMITIYERATPNSGIIGGKFLKKMRIHKPGSTPDNPLFYTPADFAIGNVLTVFSYRFLLTDVDSTVLTYLESISDQIPAHTLESVRQRLADRAAAELAAAEQAAAEEAAAEQAAAERAARKHGER
ncbi:EF-hand domain-containing protein 1-like [Genypterus blacodes]|uniref:EF-hand domain-containing protein 1-like n=1 Tax=Genypterus blacodes TaxID=154954 RepID=UPI003F760422